MKNIAIGLFAVGLLITITTLFLYSLGWLIEVPIAWLIGGWGKFGSCFAERNPLTGKCDSYISAGMAGLVSMGFILFVVVVLSWIGSEISRRHE